MKKARPKVDIPSVFSRSSGGPPDGPPPSGGPPPDGPPPSGGAALSSVQPVGEVERMVASIEESRKPKPGIVVGPKTREQVMGNIKIAMDEAERNTVTKTSPEVGSKSIAAPKDDTPSFIQRTGALVSSVFAKINPFPEVPSNPIVLLPNQTVVKSSDPPLPADMVESKNIQSQVISPNYISTDTFPSVEPMEQEPTLPVDAISLNVVGGSEEESVNMENVEQLDRAPTIVPRVTPEIRNFQMKEEVDAIVDDRQEELAKEGMGIKRNRDKDDIDPLVNERPSKILPMITSEEAAQLEGLEAVKKQKKNLERIKRIARRDEAATQARRNRRKTFNEVNYREFVKKKEAELAMASNPSSAGTGSITPQVIPIPEKTTMTSKQISENVNNAIESVIQKFENDRNSKKRNYYLPSAGVRQMDHYEMSRRSQAIREKDILLRAEKKNNDILFPRKQLWTLTQPYAEADAENIASDFSRRNRRRYASAEDIADEIIARKRRSRDEFEDLMEANNKRNREYDAEQSGSKRRNIFRGINSVTLTIPNPQDTE